MDDSNELAVPEGMYNKSSSPPSKNHHQSVRHPAADQYKLSESKRYPDQFHKSGIILLNAAATLDGCDDQLLPASFRALETELKFHPSLLGCITLAQTMAMSISCPIWGILADRYPRRFVMSVGTISWGTTTIFLAFASKTTQVFILRAINGLFLGSIGPISQSILADIIPDVSRGLQFGIIQMCTSAGRVVGGVVTTSVSSIPIAGFSVSPRTAAHTDFSPRAESAI